MTIVSKATLLTLVKYRRHDEIQIHHELHNWMYRYR